MTGPASRSTASTPASTRDGERDLLVGGQQGPTADLAQVERGPGRSAAPTGRRRRSRPRRPGRRRRRHRVRDQRRQGLGSRRRPVLGRLRRDLVRGRDPVALGECHQRRGCQRHGARDRCGLAQRRPLRSDPSSVTQATVGLSRGLPTVAPTSPVIEPGLVWCQAGPNARSCSSRRCCSRVTSSANTALPALRVGRVQPLQPRPQLVDAPGHGPLLDPRQLLPGVALSSGSPVAVRRLDRQLGDHLPHAVVGRGVQDAVHPRRAPPATPPVGDATGRCDGAPDRDVGGMPEGGQADRVEARCHQRGNCSGELQQLPVDHQPPVRWGRVGSAGAACRGPAPAPARPRQGRTPAWSRAARTAHLADGVDAPPAAPCRASRRAGATYSGRSDWSRIRATTGAAARSAATRPSARVEVVPRPSTLRIANSNSGTRLVDQLAHRLVPRAAAAGRRGRARPARPRRRSGRRTAGRRSNARIAAFWPGRVAVEGEDDLAGEGVGVHEQPAQHLDVVVAERRAAGGDGGRHAGEVAGHDVGVALDDHGLPAAWRSRAWRGRCRRAPGSSCRSASRGC